MKKFRYISEQFIFEQEASANSAQALNSPSRFMNFSFTKLLGLLALKMLPPSISNLANISLLFSGAMRFDITNVMSELLSVLREAAEKYVRGKTWKCTFKKGALEKAICLRQAYDDVIRELESRKKICNKAKNKQDCLNYISNLQNRWRQRKENLVYTNT